MRGDGPFSVENAKPDMECTLISFRPEALSEYRGRVEDMGLGIRLVKRYGFKVMPTNG